MSALSAPHFHNEEAAYAFVEARVWPEGPVCPHCGGIDRIGKMGGKSTRIGTYKCYQCRKPFTVKVGTIFESSHVPLRIWLQAMYLVAGSKKGISSNQLHRTLGVTLKTAWFMSHRIREAMRDGGLDLLGTSGGRVEADETYIGQKAGYVREAGERGSQHKMRVVSLVDRDSGKARSFPANSLQRDQVAQIVRANVAKEAKLTTDESRLYAAVGREFAAHDTVLHGAGIYVRGDVTTNTVEGFFSIFKRGMRGIYQHCAEKHLHRYLAEFDFRYSNRVALGFNDADRTDTMLKGIVGKRLTYRQSHIGA
ncbi:putative transposase [Sphingomonas changbaiensis NBRC 104936]|uniref:Putative transposase n=1 Tax=Sphingomonas changbaiensis NBRC 104936 TaxID=1219043 RepID=A0A0E9MPI3_9SPHN|nr:IS1595 family transposase [Sphingomonas changbaiensis]GAO39356.1 putative transposase [Sphingomonas changbaiensis NBRC 104936]